MVHLTLLQPHHHADKPYQVGDGISVPQVDADWLIAQGIAELVLAAESTTQQGKKKQTT